MTPTEYRILSEIALSVSFMLPVGLIAFGASRLRSSPAAAAPGYQLGGADLMMGVTVCFCFGALMFFARYQEVFGKGTSTVGSAAPSISAASMLFGMLLLHGLQVGIILAWFRVRQASVVSVFGLRRHTALKSLGLAAAMIVPATILALITMILTFIWLGRSHWQMEEQVAVRMLMQESDWAKQAVMIFGACVAAPIVEELLFRGVIYAPLRDLTDTYFAAAFSALIFGVIHLHLGSFPALTVLGFCFAMAYQATNSLLVPIFMHALFNTFQVILTLNAPH